MTQHKRPNYFVVDYSLRTFTQGVFLFFCLFFIALKGFAQPTGAEQEMFTYRVQANDTLIDLAERYTLNRDNWKTLESLNDVDDPKRLPIGKTLVIPFELIPVQPTTAELIHTQGEVWLNQRPAAVHSVIHPGDRLKTGPNSFATVGLQDQSTVSLPENTQIHFQQINEFQGVPIADVIFVLEEGTLETHADPEQQGVGRYEIHTPISVTGVRGTKMRVGADQQGSRTELLQGHAHIQGMQLAPHMLQARQGAAMDSAGQLHVTHLLDAPSIIASDKTKGGAQVSLEPVKRADHYVAIIATDPNGKHIIGQQQSNEPYFDLPVFRSGTHYAFIRAVDEYGLMGMDTVIDYPGRRVLLDRSGQPVRTHHGQAVFSGTL
ncbi:MAG TPA: FecR domain-containing protein [Paenalcaligenes sp.]|nr:FecR domain-containing protein [Paenalcaligenes sp.]